MMASPPEPSPSAPAREVVPARFLDGGATLADSEDSPTVNEKEQKVKKRKKSVESIVSRTAYCSLTLSLLLLLQAEEDVVVGGARSGDFSAAVAEVEAAYNNSTGASGMGQPMVPFRCASACQC